MPDRGTLEVLEAATGETKPLVAPTARLDTDDTYLAELTRLRFSGAWSGGQLAYTGGCDRPEGGEPASCYSDPAICYRCGSGPTTFAFDIDAELVASAFWGRRPATQLPKRARAPRGLLASV